MKNLNASLLLNLIKKDFFILKKQNFFILDYSYTLKSIKLFLRLKKLNLPIYIVLKNEQYIYLLKKYISNNLIFKNIFIINKYIAPKKDSIFLFFLSKIELKVIQNSQNIFVSVHNPNTTTPYNIYKIFVDLSNIKNVLIMISLVRKICEK
uniref:Ribosomal protein S2 n=1 Tax=Synura synuroidea TaxID=47573 RepID=Q9MGB8_9STRA|nr:ribosomal protein S2 [Synura synuroidea]AAF36931.1 ribosomal protein S2 [Synura synuroidea]